MSDWLQLFYRGADNGVWTRSRNPDDGSWSDETGLGGVLNGDPVAATPVVAVSPLGWMGQLPDASKLSQLTLPGTHESCTAFLTPIASCQNWSLREQLDHGIRYVDIRCRHVSDGTNDIFAIHHDEVYTGLNFGGDVRDVCVNWLTANPTECIVMQIKHEYVDDPNNVYTFQEVLDGYVQGFESFFYRDNRIPTLGEVRGKIVVVQRFEVDSPGTVEGLWPDPWRDNATFDADYKASDGEAVTFYIQDVYNVPTVFDINTKWNAVAALLGQANADASDAWYINFASASRDISFIFPDAVAAVINPQLYGYLAGAPFNARLGTLMMDFPDANMIGSIISLNTNK